MNKKFKFLIIAGIFLIGLSTVVSSASAQTKQEDPVSGSLSVENITVRPGEDIVLTIEAQDNQGMAYIWAYYNRSWHKHDCSGDAAECAHSFVFSESNQGTYIYHGFLTGRDLNNNWDSAYTTPRFLRVTVSSATDCQHRYWFDNDTTVCGHKQFCDSYIYQGLRTFNTRIECENALGEEDQEDPVFGTISVEKTTVNVGEDIKLTVTGQDDNGLTKIWAYYHNGWKSSSADSTEDTKTWTFSESTPGTYVYRGYIYGKKVNGLLDGRVSTPLSVIVTVVEATTKNPDLIISDISFNNDQRVNYTIKNQGNTFASPSHSRLYTNINDVGIATDYVGTLHSTNNKTEYFSSWMCVSGTSYEIKVCADTYQKISESNENNNCAETTLICPGITAKPNLLVTSLDVVNESLINFGVRNNGDAPANNFINSVDLAELAMPRTVSEVRSMSVNLNWTEKCRYVENDPLNVGDGTVSGCQYSTLLQPGAYYAVRARTDINNSVDESNENDNVKYEIFKTASTEQEDPVFGTISVDKTTVNVGEDINLTVTAQDDQGLTKIWAYYHNSWHSDYANGTSHAETWTFSESSPGTYVYRGYVYGKKLNGVRESTETEPRSIAVVVTEQQECTDSDGADYYTKGYCIDGVEGTDQNPLWDYCYYGSGTGHILAEMVCINSSCVARDYQCPYGCEDGACLREEEKSITVISPNGGEKWVQGKTYPIRWESDGVEEVDIYLLTYDAQGNYVAMTTGGSYPIASNVNSENGSYSWFISTEVAFEDFAYHKVSIVAKDVEIGEIHLSDMSDNYFSITKPATCTDSDGGKDYYVKGTITEKRDGQTYTHTDFCYAGGSVLSEYFCPLSREDFGVSEDFTCPYGCEDGECLSATSVTMLSPNGSTLEQGQQTTITWATQNYSGLIGLELYQNDNFIATIAANIPNTSHYIWTVSRTLSGSGFKIRTVLLDTIAGSITDFNDMPFKIISTEQEDPVSGTISVDKTRVEVGENIKLTVTAQDDNGLSKILAYYHNVWYSDYTDETSYNKTWTFSESSPGTYVYRGYIYGKKTDGSREYTWTNPSSVAVMVTLAATEEITCTDSDGGKNYYMKGNATPSSSAIDGRVDSCKLNFSTYMGDSVKHIGPGGGACVATGPYLYEAICGTDGNPTTVVYQCPNGCQNGVCISATIEAKKEEFSSMLATIQAAIENLIKQLKELKE